MLYLQCHFNEFDDPGGGSSPPPPEDAHGQTFTPFLHTAVTLS